MLKKNFKLDKHLINTFTFSLIYIYIYKSFQFSTQYFVKNNSWSLFINYNNR